MFLWHDVYGGDWTCGFWSTGRYTPDCIIFAEISMWDIDFFFRLVVWWMHVGTLLMSAVSLVTAAIFAIYGTLLFRVVMDSYRNNLKTTTKSESTKKSAWRMCVIDCRTGQDVVCERENSYSKSGSDNPEQRSRVPMACIHMLYPRGFATLWSCFGVCLTDNPLVLSFFQNPFLYATGA